VRGRLARRLWLDESHREVEVRERERQGGPDEPAADYDRVVCTNGVFQDESVS
jgi:hypothetical protein